MKDAYFKTLDTKKEYILAHVSAYIADERPRASADRSAVCHRNTTAVKTVVSPTHTNGILHHSKILSLPLSLSLDPPNRFNCIERIKSSPCYYSLLLPIAHCLPYETIV